MKATNSVILFLLLSLVIGISCHKSDSNGPNNKPIEYVNASVTGRVTDDNNQPVQGAVVKAGSTTANTDLNGNFLLENVHLDKNAGFVKVEKDGFFLGSRTVVVNTGAPNYVTIQLIKKTVAGTITAGNGGNVNIATGGSINFTSNSIINTATNSAYSGTVSVSAFFINPAAPNIKEIMPGTLRGINAASQETGLQSFGMMAVELNGSAGEKLQLATGKSAAITFPIPTGLQAQAPATIPLWRFNDTTGLWVEEGTATKQGNNYVGNVGHFSFWNCDYPYGVVDFKAIIKDQNGKVIPSRVAIKIVGDTISPMGDGYTDNTGLVSGKIPANKALILNVYSQCNSLLYTQNIGPFATTADLGTITINYTGVRPVDINGNVINCAGTPVTNGFVDVLVEGIHTRGNIVSGGFDVNFTRCSNTPTTAVLTAYDLGNNQIGNPVNLTLTKDTTNAGVLNACGSTVNEFMNVSFYNTNYNYIPPADTVTLGPQGSPNWYVISANRRGPGIYNYFSFMATGTGPAPADNFILIYPTYGLMMIKKSPVTVNITEFGPIGSYVAGNLSTTLKDSFQQTVTVPVNINFRVKRNN